MPALSFEFTTLQPGVAQACVRRFAEPGAYRFDAALGERQRWAHRTWLFDDARPSRGSAAGAGLIC